MQTNKLIKAVFLSSVLCLLSSVNYASGLKSLDNFLQQKNNIFSADFSQTVYGKKKDKVSTGKMEIKRPNKFKWQYLEEEQLIISDGKNIYIYDKPLQQVTQKKLSASLGKSPALLLAGGNDIKKYYNVKELPEKDGLEWIELLPKNVNDNNGFKKIEIGFDKKDQALKKMQFIDSFDNKSQISFSNVKTGIKIADKEFEFKAPKDVDVIKADE